MIAEFGKGIAGSDPEMWMCHNLFYRNDKRDSDRRKKLHGLKMIVNKAGFNFTEQKFTPQGWDDISITILAITFNNKADEAHFILWSYDGIEI
jgi:hypothetical protein